MTCQYGGGHTSSVNIGAQGDPLNLGIVPSCSPIRILQFDMRMKIFPEKIFRLQRLSRCHAVLYNS